MSARKKKKQTRRRRRRKTTITTTTTTTTTTTETAWGTLFKTHSPDPHLYKKIPQPDPPFFFKSWGSGFPQLFSFKLQKHPRNTQPLFEPPWTQFWLPTSQNCPNWTPPPPTPPRLASLYTYTQHRPSAGFRNIYIYTYIYIYIYIYIYTYTYTYIYIYTHILYIYIYIHT